jgi:hypothetical protein
MEDLEIISLASTVGNGLEIKCGVEKSDNSEIVKCFLSRILTLLLWQQKILTTT